ncbi:MAG: penicillin-binding protein [Oscillibacter sp.]|jgi:peptidoglycan glycosyltransferase|nr:penicillin-binding protein [Oscillibacter sp.]
MKKIEHRAVICRILALALVVGMGIFVFRWATRGNRWVSAAFNRHLYNSDGVLASGTVLDRDGDVLSSVGADGKRTYYASADVRKATLHAVGDLQGNIATGALNAFAGDLTGFNLLGGAFDARRGNSLYLTIDAYYNNVAYQALNGRRGAVCVYNYKTGEILCMVSAPSYDPMNVPADLTTSDRYQGAYLNRVLSSTFTPGSVFKTVTAAAAIEKLPDYQNRTWTCRGSVTINGNVITCAGRHGEQTLGQALANSCNVAFAEIADELGADTLRAYTEKAGLTDSYSVSGLPTAKGTFDFKNLSDDQLGWAGVGQYRDLVNPCALMVYMGAVAGGGKAAEPYLAEKTVSPLGIKNSLRTRKTTDTLIDPSTAAVLADMMADNVDKTYGRERFPNMDLCAKSGTAEVGDGKSPHAWFTGFLRDADKPYAFTVLVENGGGGASVAGTVAGKVLRAVTGQK